MSVRGSEMPNAAYIYHYRLLLLDRRGRKLKSITREFTDTHSAVEIKSKSFSFHFKREVAGNKSKNTNEYLNHSSLCASSIEGNYKMRAHPWAKFSISNYLRTII